MTTGGNSSIPYEEGTERQATRRPLAHPPGGNSSIPYEEGTERNLVSRSSRERLWGNSSIPYEEGTESRGRVALRGLGGTGVTAAFPMKRELKAAAEDPVRAGLGE